MTASTREILDRFQIRKSKKQKTAFIEYVTGFAEQHGYTAAIEKGNGARNIVIGDPDTAKVVCTAHYDTCAVMPFPNFITPKSIPLYVLYQLVIVAGFLLFAFAIGFVAALIGAPLGLPRELVTSFAILVYWALLVLLIAGPANKHTVNDNTSGVTVLLDTMAALPAEERGKVCFVFFDLEEAGLFGSSAFASRHKKAMKNKLLLNFDCVSDGETILFALKKKAVPHQEKLEQAFAPSGSVRVELASKNVIYPSDQANFPIGVGVAALKTAKKSGILYMDRIHTKRDTIYREENIAFLKDGILRLLSLL